MNRRTLGTIALIATLVSVLAVPVLAEAGRGNAQGGAAASERAQAKKALKASGKSNGSAASSNAAAERRAAKREARKAARTSKVAKRISNRLAARKARFDAVTANLERRIERIAALTAKVEAAGGDVSAAEAKLGEARQHLAAALDIEQDAIAKFEAIPGSANQRAAFAAAKARGREAVAELKATRVAIREAAEALRVVVQGLLASEAIDGA